MQNFIHIFITKKQGQLYCMINKYQINKHLLALFKTIVYIYTYMCKYNY